MYLEVDLELIIIFILLFLFKFHGLDFIYLWIHKNTQIQYHVCSTKMSDMDVTWLYTWCGIFYFNYVEFYTLIIQHESGLKDQAKPTSF